MNKFLVILVAFSISCVNGKSGPQTKSAPKGKNESAVAQDVDQKDILIGPFQRKDLEKEPYKEWFTSNYESYTPSSEEMKMITENINDYKITVFMGTWCSDSKREVPRLFKMLDESGYDSADLKLIAVDESKETPSGIEKEYDVEYVPTIIFEKNGKEVNRFVEYPQGESLEHDLSKIVTGKAYKNSYAE